MDQVSNRFPLVFSVAFLMSLQAKSSQQFDPEAPVSAIRSLQNTRTLQWSEVLPDLSQRHSLASPSLPDTPIDTAQIINLGKQVWEVIKAGQSVVNVQSDHATALPKGIDDWTQLEDWNPPEAKTYSIQMKNLAGLTVVELKYTLVSISGGKLNGRGQYLAYVALEPSEINVLWGFNLNASTKVNAVFNRGTKANPIGSVQMDIHYEVSSLLTKFQRTDRFAVSGDGKVVFLNQAQ